MKTRVNLERIVQCLLLLSLFMMFDSLLTTNAIGLYLHPRFNTAATAATIALALLFFWRLVGLFTFRKNTPVRLQYIAFLAIPALFLLSPQQPLDASFASLRGASVDNATLYANPQATAAPPPGSLARSMPVPDQPPAEEPAASEALVDHSHEPPLIADSLSFVPVLKEIFDDPGKYQGRRLIVYGWKFSTDEVAANRFIIARLGIFCCAADAEVVGIICQTEKPSALIDNVWYRFEGILRMEKPADRTDVDLEPYLVLESYKPITPPKDKYVYLNQY
jgi:putative membrane protein